MEFSYKGYSAARDASWQTLTENNIGDLPVDVFKLAQDMGIKVVPYSKSRSLMMLLGLARHRANHDGLYVRFLGKSYIFYDDDVSSQGRIRFTIAHEIGHHILGHIRHNLFVVPRCAERRRGGSPNARERQANIFASRLLAPSAVLKALNVATEDEVANLCGISKEAAEYRLKRLKEIDAHGIHSMSRLEKQVLENFKEFIEKNKKPSP